MEKNRKIKFFLVIIISILLVYTILINNETIQKIKNNYFNNLPIYYSNSISMYDTSTPEKAIGCSDYVFIAHINRILRTEYKYPVEVEIDTNKTEVITTPYTVYSINVIKNIKGTLDTSKPIEFMQYGGINDDNKSYTFTNGGSLLTEGNYYILMVDTWGGEGGTIEISDTNRIINLGKDFSPNARNYSDIISKYEEAYKNEIVPEQETNIMSKFDINYINTNAEN